jgi:hypothetical protein
MSRKYLDFELMEEKPKTRVWNVVARRSGDSLGVVAWFAPWRQYCFSPQSDTVFSRGCMETISRFIEEQMVLRKERRKNERR